MGNNSTTAFFKNRLLKLYNRYLHNVQFYAIKKIESQVLRIRFNDKAEYSTA